jgi:hypothetical protein
MAQAFYRIHDANIHAMHMPGGPVYNLIAETGVAAKEVARLTVGHRTGKLMNSIRFNTPKQEGGFSIAGLLYANAKHAHWHHEGTLTRTPKPKHGKYMTVPRKWSTVEGGKLRREWMGGGASGPKPYFLAVAVRGQDGNPYLKIGIETAMGRDTRLSFTGI